MPTGLYRAIDVWRRTEDGRLVRYRCFEDLTHGGYCVQSSDFYSSPDDERRLQLNRQLIELLLEQSPAERGGVHPTLEEAIAAHDAAFAEGFDSTHPQDASRRQGS